MESGIRLENRYANEEKNTVQTDGGFHLWWLQV